MRLVTLDWESYYSTEYSLSKMTTEAYVRDPQFQAIGLGIKFDNAPTDWIPATPGRLERALAKIDWSTCAVLAHNTRFDAAILEWRYGVRPAFYFDTLSMARAIHGIEGSLSLASLAERYGLGVKGTEVNNAKGKRLEDFTPAELERYGDYCINDVELTRQLFFAMRTRGDWRYPTKELAVIDLMLRMYVRPTLKLHEGRLEEHLGVVQRKKELLLKQVEKVAGKDALMSNDKLAAILTGLGVEVPMKLSPAALKRGEEKLTYAFGKTDTEFKALLDHDDLRVQAVVAARMGVRSTQAETRAQTFIGIAQRGPLPVPLGYYNAHTGRAGGEEKVNMQNLPARTGDLSLRRAVMPALDDHSMVTCDSAQIEARVLAYLAGEWGLVEDFRNKVDIYSDFASDVYGYKVDRKLVEVGPDGKEFNPFKKEGMVGKEGILGLGFGMGGEKFKLRLKQAAGVTVAQEDATNTVNIYRRRFPAIKALWADCQRAIKQMTSGYIYTIGVGVRLHCFPADERGPARILLPNGMFLRYPELRGEAGGKYGVEYKYTTRKGRKVEAVFIHGAKLVENIVQALARIIVFNQLLEIDRWMRTCTLNKDEHLAVAMTVHDEADAVCPDRLVPIVKDKMLEIMSTPPDWAPDLPIAAEAGSGKNFGDA